MRTTILLLLLCISTSVMSQPGTDIYLFDLVKTNKGYSLANPTNITNNPGYDNQPSFLIDDSGILMAATKDGQTDIALYDIENGKLNFLMSTPEFSEYSPVQTPDGAFISYITLSTDGVQQFRKSTPGSEEAVMLETKRIVGYYAWYDDDRYLSFILPTDTEPATLQWHNSATGEKLILADNPGRSFHKMANKNALTYILKKEDVWEIHAYYPEQNTSTFITNTIADAEDMALTPNGDIFMGNGSELFVFTGERWTSVANLSTQGISGISRLAISHAGDKIAIVANEKLNIPFD